MADNRITDNNANELSLKDLLNKFKLQFNYLKSSWKKLLLFTMIGAITGFALSILIKPSYRAITTFVLEDAKGGGLSQYAGLASIAGINLNSEGGGLFEGDNILQLYTSRAMIEQTLLSKAKFNNKEILLINRYIDFNNLRNDWSDELDLEHINFDGNPANFSRAQDSIISDVTEKINEKNLYVTRGDKKFTTISVEFNTKDELFAQQFSKNLVENVNTFYIKTKTKKASTNLAVLQSQADSVRQILNSSISGVASLTDDAPNANPNMLSLRVPSQKKQVDLQASAAIYTEVVKNMEIAKMSLLQAKPLIQIIDEPILPLKKNYIKKKVGIAIGAVIGFIICAIGLLVIKFFKSALN